MRPMLALMAYGGLAAPLVESVLNEMRASVYPWLVRVGGSDAAIDRARSVVATEFLEGSKGDVLVMVDHDIAWNVGDLCYIAEAAHDRRAVVGGLVSKRALGEGLGGRFADGKPHEFGTHEIVKLGPRGHIGGAFMAIHRDVLEAVLGKLKLPRVRTGFVPFFLPEVRYDEHTEQHEYLSEDWAFVSRCHQAGCDVYAAMHPITAHFGQYGYTVLSAVGGES